VALVESKEIGRVGKGGDVCLRVVDAAFFKAGVGLSGKHREVLVQGF
jgi:hypothetical protein